MWITPNLKYLKRFLAGNKLVFHGSKTERFAPNWAFLRNWVSQPILNSVISHQRLWNVFGFGKLFTWSVSLLKLFYNKFFGLTFYGQLVLQFGLCVEFQVDICSVSSVVLALFALQLLPIALIMLLIFVALSR